MLHSASPRHAFRRHEAVRVHDACALEVDEADRVFSLDYGLHVLVGEFDAIECFLDLLQLFVVLPSRFCPTFE